MGPHTIEINLNTGTQHITITSALFGNQIPDDEEVSRLLSNILTPNTLENIVYKSVVIRP